MGNVFYTQVCVLQIGKYLWLVVKQKYKSKDISKSPWDLYSSPHLQSACLKCLYDGVVDTCPFWQLTTDHGAESWLCSLHSVVFFLILVLDCVFVSWGDFVPDSLLEPNYLFHLEMRWLSIWERKKTINAVLFDELADYEDTSINTFWAPER